MDGFGKQQGGAPSEGKEEVERPPSFDADDGTVASSAEAGAAALAAAAGGLTTPPYIHLVFLRSHPQASAQGFLSAFAALQAQGRVDRAKVVRVL